MKSSGKESVHKHSLPHINGKLKPTIKEIGYPLTCLNHIQVAWKINAREILIVFKELYFGWERKH